MDLRQAFKILEISENATKLEAKQAYRDLVQIWHPDRYNQNKRLQQKALEKMKELNAAYDYICIHLNAETSTNANKNNAQNQSSTEYIIICPKCGTKNRSYSPIISPQAICGRCGSHLLHGKQQSGDEWEQRTPCGNEACIGVIDSTGRCTHCGKTYEEGVAAEKEWLEKERDKTERETEKHRIKKSIIYSLIGGGIMTIAVVIALNYINSPSPKPLPAPIVNPPVFEPIDPIRLKTGTALYSGRRISGHSTITVDNGTDTDAVVRVIRFSNGIQEKVRNFYLQAHSKYTAKQIPPGIYILKVAFGMDWNLDERKFNYKKSYSKTQNFTVDETTSIESTDDGEVQRIRSSALSITLHKVRHGNFKTHPIDEDEFWQ